MIEFCFLLCSRAVQKNSDLLPSTPLSNLLFNDFWGTPLKHSGSHKSYRPVCVASFRLNYKAGGLNPRGYHAVNIALHGAVCWLVVVLAYELLGAHVPSFVSGVLFAVHPVHTGMCTHNLYYFHMFLCLVAKEETVLAKEGL